MRRIVYLTFYFRPDLCAGSFRNSPLALELAKQARIKDTFIDIYTTIPNRYSSFDAIAPPFEEFENIKIHRISLPVHKSGMLDQVFSFWSFYKEVIKLSRNKKASLVFASSSRLFTAFLGYRIANKSKVPLYLDVRDIFVDTLNDVIKSKILKNIVLPFLKLIESKTFNYASHINLNSEGFKDYFQKYKRAHFSYFPNGIDEEFINKSFNDTISVKKNTRKLIVYAGNIGEGQGLHKIIPLAAKLLGKEFQFLVIGDGGTRKLLQTEIERIGIKNVVIRNPIDRSDLKIIYNEADYLFLHLNDYLAFRKVLPSKIFELATFNKTIIAGVSGYSAKFIRDEVPHSFVFAPCDVNALVEYLKDNKEGGEISREIFVDKYKKSNINKEMAASILRYI
jgi:UDP-N-acetylglucosamine:LPS N-acetylglucosamine transferase